MSEERSEIIKRFAKEGKLFEELRVFLISNGYPTADAESIFTEAGGVIAKKTKTPPPNGYIVNEQNKYGVSTEVAQKGSHVQSLLKKVPLLICVLIVSCLLYFVVSHADTYMPALQKLYEQGMTYFIASENKDDEAVVSDTVRKRQMDSLSASAFIYRNRIISYDGLCKSIGVPDEVECKSNNSSFIMQTRLSTGNIYCVDSSEYRGEVEVPKTLSDGCQ